MKCSSNRSLSPTEGSGKWCPNNLHNNISLTSITENGSDILESNIKIPITTTGQSTMDNLSEEEMLVLTIKASTKEIDPQITMNLSEVETRELTCKASSIEETATHQNEEEDYEGIERH